jgi:hypothetical protein
MSVLSQFSDWKQFERLCADLLESEGFVVVSEPGVDRSGTDIRVMEEYRSHDPTRTIRVRWRVQCKHFAPSGRNLGRKDVEESLYAFEATRAPDEGLFLIVSTDYTEAAKEVLDQYLILHPSSRITVWNARQILARLDRHPQLLRRYRIARIESDYIAAISPLSRLASRRVLLLSDQSALAHNLASALRHAGFELVFLPFWNYQDPLRLELTLGVFKDTSFHLIVSFLGDSFGRPMPERLTSLILQAHRKGASLLLFPFLAWSMHRGLYPELITECPVELLDPAEPGSSVDTRQILGDFRRGDFRWLLEFDSFAEDWYVEFDTQKTDHPLTDGIGGRFGLSHSFEYLRSRPGATLALADTAGNPFVVTKESHAAKACYVNTCCHSCMSPIAVSSPLEVSSEFAALMRNVLLWLLDHS